MTGGMSVLCTPLQVKWNWINRQICAFHIWHISTAAVIQPDSRCIFLVVDTFKINDRFGVERVSKRRLSKNTISWDSSAKKGIVLLRTFQPWLSIMHEGSFYSCEKSQTRQENAVWTEDFITRMCIISEKLSNCSSWTFWEIACFLKPPGNHCSKMDCINIVLF